MTSQLNVALNYKIRGSLMCLDYFRHVIPGLNLAYTQSGQGLNICTVVV